MTTKKKIILFFLAILISLAVMKPSKQNYGFYSEFNLSLFGSLPVLQGGRVKPIDTIARNGLLSINGKQILRIDGKKMSAIEWFFECAFNSEEADKREVFLIQNKEVLDSIKQFKTTKKRFSYLELSPYLTMIEEKSDAASKVESAVRTPFQKGIIALNDALFLYIRLKNTFCPQSTENWSEEIKRYEDILVKAMAEINSKEKKHEHSHLTLFKGFLNRYRSMATLGHFSMFPKGEDSSVLGDWLNPGEIMIQFLHKKTWPDLFTKWNVVLDSAISKDGAGFNQNLEAYLNDFREKFPTWSKKSEHERWFNTLDAFYKCSVLYVLILLIGVISWIKWERPICYLTFTLLIMAFVMHSLGLGMRMYLESRPPVTNLYSSAVFIGWFAVLMGIFTERVFKNGIAVFVTSLVGFSTLIIAHHLSIGGDTLEMMRAVLDSNFWLATHVVTISIGYSATFMAGFIGLMYSLRRLLSKSFDSELQKQMGQMTYGIICFAIFFSLVGTVLGGIWADQSWGRFWGWDPKENGALMIVLWNLAIVHARLAGMIRIRGLMIFAILGNIITAWSWFGVNMLGIGLHSYGFMDRAFIGLMSFIAIQVFFVLLNFVPKKPFSPS